jgi:ubiquinone/menaquinone biosynthesis C-methylase UbiE
MLSGHSTAVNVILWIIIVLCGAIFYWVVIHRTFKHFVHYPVPAFAAPLLDNPIRRIFQPPEKLIDQMDIREGMKVLEVGPGPGTFTIEAAKRVGFQGEVFVIDIQPRIISRLDRRLRREGISNATTKVASADHLPFADNTFDRVFMVAVLGEIPNKDKALSEARRVLKDTGLVAIGEVLIDPDYPRQKSVIRWCRDAGLQLVSAHDGFMQYVLTFKKA